MPQKKLFMSGKLGIFSVCYLLLLVGGCASKTADSQQPSQVSSPQTVSTSSPNVPKANGAASEQPVAGLGATPEQLDACALIEKSEIASVLGAPVQSTKPSSHLNGALAISQCYYTVTSADSSKNLSIHLEVIQADPRSGRPNAANDYWETSFHGERAGDEEEKESGKPIAISGIGEAAFWTGNSRAGAVYVLNKRKVVRISLGGSDDPKTKIKKSKTLVANVLKRLS
jgi:hypothetical protein